MQAIESGGSRGDSQGTQFPRSAGRAMIEQNKSPPREKREPMKSRLIVDGTVLSIAAVGLAYSVHLHNEDKFRARGQEFAQRIITNDWDTNHHWDPKTKSGLTPQQESEGLKKTYRIDLSDCRELFKGFATKADIERLEQLLSERPLPRQQRQASAPSPK